MFLESEEELLDAVPVVVFDRYEDEVSGETDLAPLDFAEEGMT